MSWGTKILMVYVAFVAGIVFMVFKSSSTNTDLVTPDYYEKELKYQDKIEEMKRTTALTAQVECRVKDNILTIVFPADFKGRQLVGEAEMYCPSNKKNDFKEAFSVLDNALQVTIPEGRKGQYELHLSWKDGGVTYYFEKKIFI